MEHDATVDSRQKERLLELVDDDFDFTISRGEVTERNGSKNTFKSRHLGSSISNLKDLVVCTQIRRRSPINDTGWRLSFSQKDDGSIFAVLADPKRQEHYFSDPDELFGRIDLFKPNGRSEVIIGHLSSKKGGQTRTAWSRVVVYAPTMEDAPPLHDQGTAESREARRERLQAEIEVSLRNFGFKSRKETLMPIATSVGDAVRLILAHEGAGQAVSMRFPIDSAFFETVSTPDFAYGISTYREVPKKGTDMAHIESLPAKELLTISFVFRGSMYADPFRAAVQQAIDKMHKTTARTLNQEPTRLLLEARRIDAIVVSITNPGANNARRLSANMRFERSPKDGKWKALK